MKRYFSLIAAVLLAFSVTLSAKDHNSDPDKYFLPYDRVPNSLTILPPPPADSSARFAYDREQYLWGKSLRDTPRGAQAVADATLGEQWVNEVFGEAFGYDLSHENAPRICRLIETLRHDAGDLSTRAAKQHYMRTRPFVRWNEPTATPSHEKFLRGNGSYPSGHTAIGWAAALVLAEINPDRATEIISRGYEFGQSRVIVGAHYQSDVDMGRVVGAAIVAALHADKGFRRQLADAEKEFRKISKKAAKKAAK